MYIVLSCFSLSLFLQVCLGRRHMPVGPLSPEEEELARDASVGTPRDQTDGETTVRFSLTLFTSLFSLHSLLLPLLPLLPVCLGLGLPPLHSPRDSVSLFSLSPSLPLSFPLFPSHTSCSVSPFSFLPSLPPSTIFSPFSSPPSLLSLSLPLSLSHAHPPDARWSSSSDHGTQWGRLPQRRSCRGGQSLLRQRTDPRLSP